MPSIRREMAQPGWRAGAVVLAAVVWLLATEPWGIAAYQLIVFAAPGGLLGLATGWMAYAADQPAWGWRTGARWAMAGAIALPPILAFMVAVDGNARPHRLLAGFIRAAWLALALGLSVAAARGVARRLQERRQKVRAALEQA